MALHKRKTPPLRHAGGRLLSLLSYLSIFAGCHSLLGFFNALCLCQVAGAYLSAACSLRAEEFQAQRLPAGGLCLTSHLFLGFLFSHLISFGFLVPTASGGISQMSPSSYRRGALLFIWLIVVPERACFERD